MKTAAVLLVLLIVILSVVGGCMSPSVPRQESSQTPAPAATPNPPVSLSQQTPASPSLSLKVDSLDPGATLPDIYTCNGAGESPAISWQNLPSGVKGLVLILEDPDAPSGTFTHWIVYNIPPGSPGLAGNQPDLKVLPDGSQQGLTTMGVRGYSPPCPPSGTTHHYIFRLYAVDMDIVQPTADRASIETALTGHTLGQAEFRTLFGR